MPRTSYVNGCYVEHLKAAVHIEDRGYQFADGVYEVIGIFESHLVDGKQHIDRLERSLYELQIDRPVGRATLNFIIQETIRRNYVRNGNVYVQISRGVAERDHLFPEFSTSSLIVTTSSKPWPSLSEAKTGHSIITGPDIRWQRCDIKSVSLLPNVLAKQNAKKADSSEVWMTDDHGFVTEGTASNAWIVTSEEKIVTRPADGAILGGITRERIIRLVESEGYEICLRSFSIEEAKYAKEAFFTSSTATIKPVTRIDGQIIGNGQPGEITCRLIDLYFDHMSGAGEGR